MRMSSLRQRELRGNLGQRGRMWALGVMLGIAWALCAGSPAHAATGPISPGAAQLGGYETESGLTAGVAEEELRTQQQGAAVVGLLQLGIKDDYAGVWFDPQEGKFVVPYTQPGDRQVIERIMGELGLGGSTYRLQAVSHTWDELVTRQEKLLEALAPATAGQVQVSIAPETNAVVLEEADGAVDGVAATLRGLAADPGEKDLVEARTSSVPSLTKEKVNCLRTEPRHCDAPLRGGVEIGVRNGSSGDETITSGVCTAGFKALGNVYGNRFILTAGHCSGYAQHPLTSSYLSRTVDGEEHTIGQIEEFEVGPRGDFAKIKANGSYWDTKSWPSEVAFYSENEEYPIDYEAWTYPGEYVCFSGQTSGSSCGIVQRTRVTENAGYPQAEILGACVDPGDSGGPVFSFTSNTGLGLMEEIYEYEKQFPKEGRCGEEYSFYDELPEVTTGLGVSVGTRIGGAPFISEGGATGITQTTTTLNGEVYPNAVETTYHFEYGTTTSYGSSIPIPDGNIGHGTEGVPVSVNLTGLSPLTAYHWRIVATSPAGTTIGVDRTFETLPEAPRLVTAPAEEIKVNQATLTGSVNPHGSPTTYHFAWGTSYSSLGSSTPETPAGSGRASVPVRQTITGLEPGHEYFYQLVATNAGGTSRGSIGHFVTLKK
jgi:hypothetical protein